MQAITFRCTSCNKVLKIAAEKAGRKAKCTCGAVLTIPNGSEPEPPPPPPPQPTVQEEESYGLIKEDETGPNAPSAQEAYSWKAGKAKKRDSIEADLEAPEKKKPSAKQDKGKEVEKPKMRATRTLLEPERWKKVNIGLQVLAAAMGVAVLAVLLPKTMWLQQSASSDYAATRLALMGDDRDIYYYMKIFAGEGGSRATVSVVALIVGQVFAILSGMVLIGGYLICLSVPTKFGTTGQVLSLLGLAGINLILRFGFWLVPLFGFGYMNLPLLLPEMSMISAGNDRVDALMLNYMGRAAFWETLLAIFLIAIQLAEPVLLGVFIRSIGLSMKDDLVSAAGLRLVKLTMSQAFFQVFLYLAFLTGTSNVLQTVLMVIYWLGWAFWLGTVIYFIIVLLWVPKRIRRELGDDAE